ncbi:MAG: hypothetical protein KDA31_04660 [Phycisphaerales bacterium]|nr:hypothetical protein [Phycisphaerales bacterium]
MLTFLVTFEELVVAFLVELFFVVDFFAAGFFAAGALAAAFLADGVFFVTAFLVVFLADFLVVEAFLATANPRQWLRRDGALTETEQNTESSPDAAVGQG